MSTGKIGGYAYGEHIKTKMLSDEGIEIKNGKILNLEDMVYRF
jgi:methylated-DNA-[protein]-cysteine S-methyltransferase